MMTQAEALKTLIEIAVIAQKRGVLGLQEAAIVWQAIQTFQADGPNSDPASEEKLPGVTVDEDSLED